VPPTATVDLKAERTEQLQRLEQDIDRLEADLARTQEQFARISKQVQGDAQAMKEWVDLSNETLRNTWDRTLSFTADMLIGMPMERLAHLTRLRNTAINDKMGSLLNQLINSRDPAQRAQIRAALAPLRKERDILSGDWIRPRPGFQAVNTVSAGRGLSVGSTERLIQNVGEAKSTYDLAQWTESTSGDFERLEEGTRLLSDMCFSQVDLNLEVTAKSPGWSIGTYIQFGHFIVDTSQDVLAQCLSVQRVNQLDRNSEEYLRAVDALSKHMKTTMETLKTKRAEYKAAVAGQVSGGAH
jgi:hypothetical protein